MKKLSSPWRSHYRIVEMITPVTALIRNQKSGAYKTVHVNNLRYAHINDRWDLNDCNDEEIQEEFPEQNTRKPILHRRKQPDRSVKSIQNTVRMEDVWNDEDSSENTTDEEVFTEQEKQVIFMPFRQANELQENVSIGRKIMNIILRKYKKKCGYPMCKKILQKLQLILTRETSLK